MRSMIHTSLSMILCKLLCLPHWIHYNNPRYNDDDVGLIWLWYHQYRGQGGGLVIKWAFISPRIVRLSIISRVIISGDGRGLLYHGLLTTTTDIWQLYLRTRCWELKNSLQLLYIQKCGIKLPCLISQTLQGS